MKSSMAIGTVMSSLALAAAVVALPPLPVFAQAVSPECAGVLAQNAEILQEFAGEAEEFGEEFAMDELTASSRAVASQQLRNIEVGDLTLGDYEAAYKRIDGQINRITAFDQWLDDVRTCLGGISSLVGLIDQAEQQNACFERARARADEAGERLLDRLAELANLRQVMDRVERAGEFLQGYTQRLAGATTDNASQAAQCLAVAADAAAESGPTETADLTDPAEAGAEEPVDVTDAPPVAETGGGGNVGLALGGVAVGAGVAGGLWWKALQEAQADDDFCDAQRALAELNALNACLRSNFSSPEACGSELAEVRRFCNCTHDFAVSLGGAFQNQCP